MTGVAHSAVTKIWQESPRLLGLEWDDGMRALIDVVELRRKCPCAVCVDEMSGRRTIKPEDIDEAVRPIQIKSVGRYALGVEFSDGHRTGIYTYDSLRRFQ